MHRNVKEILYTQEEITQKCKELAKQELDNETRMIQNKKEQDL